MGSRLSVAARCRRIVCRAVAAAVAATVAGGAVALSLTMSDAPARADATSAPVFLSSVVRLLVENRYGDAWTTLNPADKAVAPYEVYVACESSRPIPVRFVSLRAIRVRRDHVSPAPGQGARAATVVTFALRVSTGTGALDVVVTRHAIRDHGSWTWILSPKLYAAYAHRRCGRPGPPA